MHLSECIDLFSESKSIDSEVTECLSRWAFKSRTEFYECDDLVLNPFFGALCWSYSLGGIFMLLIRSKSKWVTRSNFPYTPYALLMTFVQGKKARYEWFEIPANSQSNWICIHQRTFLFTNSLNSCSPYQIEKVLCLSLQIIFTWKMITFRT